MRGKMNSGLAIILCLFFAAPAMAGNRALIVTVGPAYAKNGLRPIPGPEIDEQLAKGLAKQMGFNEDEIRLIREDQATRPAILEGLDWVKEGTKGGGNALIYYSGHGDRVYDEKLDRDEKCHQALVPVDATSEDKYILDDELDRFLKGMPDPEVVFMVDSCFSGTIVKSVFGGSIDNTKYLGKGDARCKQAVINKSIIGMEKDGQPTKNLVAITATAKNERAYGDLTESGKGSLFTQSIHDTVSAKRQGMSFRTLRDEASQKIKQVCDAKNVAPHTPQLAGNPSLFDKDIRLTGQTYTYEGGIETSRSNQEILGKLVNNSKFMVAIKLDKKTIQLKEDIHFSVASSKEGYLNLVELEPNGKLSVIFPNQYSANNRIKADVEIKVPKDIGGFKFVGREPAGKSMVVALVTNEPLNLYTEKEVGEKIGHFKSIGADASSSVKEILLRSIEVKPIAGSTKEFGAAGAELDIAK